MKSYRLRRFVIVVLILLLGGSGLASTTVDMPNVSELLDKSSEVNGPVPSELAELPVKGRAPKTGYARSEFGNGWSSSLGCDTRNRILSRDMSEEVFDDMGCKVQSGVLNDPYTGKIIRFVRGEQTSDDVQIDHVVALSNAWQTGAQQLTYEQRVAFSNDPLNLLAVDGPTNEKKSDGDAATWLPPNKAFRCQYIKRQVSVKQKYGLWVTQPERDAILRILNGC